MAFNRDPPLSPNKTHTYLVWSPLLPRPRAIPVQQQIALLPARCLAYGFETVQF